jgi:signal transduction histidine kinase
MRPFRLILCIVVASFCITKTSAQISDSFYNSIYPDNRPVNKAKLTHQERIDIINHMVADQIEKNKKEALQIVETAKQILDTTNSQELKVKYAYALGDFYVVYSNYNAAFFYLKKVTEYAKDNAAFNKLVCQSYAMMASIYSLNIEADSAVVCLHNAIDKINPSDSIALTTIYEAYINLYKTLDFRDSVIRYAKKYTDIMPANLKWDDDYVIVTFELPIAYNRLYLNTKNQEYADSSSLILHKLMQMERSDSALWYSPIYYYLGQLKYYEGQYQQAIMYYDSALLPVYANGNFKNTKLTNHCILERALCFIKTGHPEAIRILDTLQLEKRDFFSIRGMNQVLYEDAKAKGNWKDALRYYERYIGAVDSLDIIDTRGRVFEANQKYSVAKKEATINSLEKDKLLQEKNAIKIRVIVTVIVLSLIIAILLLVWYYKQLQLRKEKEKEKLADDLTKAEMKMINERSEQQLRQQILIKEQREKISKNIHDEINSGLAALRFYITDLKASATETKTKDVLAKVEEEAGHLYLQARDFMNNLNADKPIANYNILSLLENLAARFNDESILHIENKIDEAGIEKNFTAKQHYEMYSIIKESMTNIIKHAGATKVTTSIAFNNDRCEFSIADNGKGFNRQQIKEGLGLKSLESRIVNELQGEFKINSSMKGTVVNGSFPV